MNTFQNGYISCIPYAVSAAVQIFGGRLVDWLNGKSRMSSNGMRKSCNTISIIHGL